MLEVLRKERNMAKVNHIHKLVCIVASLKMGKKMDMVTIFIQIKILISEIGKMINFMEKV